MQQKCDLRSKNFSVHSQAEVPYVVKTLEEWYASCDGMLLTLESQVARANQAKAANKEHRAKVNRQVSMFRLKVRVIRLSWLFVPQISEIRGQLKAQQKITDSTDDPDSRMDTDRSTDRRDKKNPGGSASGSGGGKGAKMGSRGAGKGLWPK